ncbi:MAG TPA: hypothetical protein VNT30_13975 [Stellaceae bacterium]|nr:hypothetical protein [Stellaceae bacterium]
MLKSEKIGRGFTKRIWAKRIWAGAAVASIGLAPLAADAACFTQPEWVAAHVRVLQTELMVAALECKEVPGRDFTPQYNAFIGKYGTSLRSNSELLKGHFSRSFGAGYSREMDLYITKIANDASQQSMLSVGYCDEAAGLFQNTLLLEPQDLERYSVDRIVNKTNVGDFCIDARAVKAVEPPSKKAPVKAKRQQVTSAE